MGSDLFNLALSGTIIFVYGIACIISLIFTFSLETYRKIDELITLDIIPARVLTPLERNINFVDEWLKRNNKIMGPILILFSLVDLKSLLRIIYSGGF